MAQHPTCTTTTTTSVPPRGCPYPSSAKSSLASLLFLYSVAATVLFLVHYNDDITPLYLYNKHKNKNSTNKIAMSNSSSSTLTPQLVFVHPGKTGGTSLCRFLRLFCQVREKAESEQFCLQEFRDSHTVLATTTTTTTTTSSSSTSSSHANTNTSTETNTSSHNTNTNKTLLRVPESAISQYTHGGIHVDWIYPSTEYTTQEATHYLITARNPMERVVSWFYFMHPQNCYTNRTGTPTPRKPFALIDKACIAKRNMEKSHKSKEYLFYKVCFPQVEDFVQTLSLSKSLSLPLNKSRQKQSRQQMCYKLAHEMMQGVGGPNGMAGHLHCDYQYYAALTTQVQPNKPVLVARTEHLWQDLSNIDQLLGGTGQAFHNQIEVEQYEKTRKQQAQQQPQQSQPHYHKDELSPQGYQILCCHLQDEIAVYQQWLQKAINLQDHEKYDSMQKVLQQCVGKEDEDGLIMMLLQSLDELTMYCTAQQ